jgi:beta-N-acetylhexosaminidase
VTRVLVASLGVLALALTGCASSTQSADKAPAKLTLRQQIGQHFVFPFGGTTPPKALTRRIRRGETAGVILFSRNIKSVAQVRRMTRDLQAIRRPKGMTAPLLVMVDQEGGIVKRLPGAPASAAAQMNSSAGGEGAATAALLRSAGVNVDLAPVVDLARPGSAMQNEGRSFGSTAATVTEFAGAFSNALKQGGVASALKHFPGFGAAKANTDNAAVRIDLGLDELRAADLVPYQRIDAPIVLMSTAIYPNVDPAPAAFSRRWTTTELRRRIGFGGVVMTDDLQTPAVEGYGTPAQLAFFAVSSGADMPLFAKRYGTAAQAAAGLMAAVRQGKLTRAQLDAGARRVLALRAALADGAL